MKIQRLYLGPYRWRITVFYDTFPEDSDTILKCLADIGCERRKLGHAEENLRGGARNTGLTFSNRQDRESIIVLSESSSEAEFANTWFHEVFHAAVHIAEADGLGCNGEPVAYIGGYIAMRMQPQASLFMCSKCHKYEMQEN